jgi:hypothetical protein
VLDTLRCVGGFSWFEDDVIDGPAQRLPRQEPSPMGGHGAGDDTPALDQAQGARRAAWEALGEVDADVLAPAVNPAVLAGPEWPALRQSFLRVRAPDSVVLASDGLSDPHRDPALAKPRLSGLGLEVFLETGDVALGDAELSAVLSTWAFHLVYEMAQNAAYLTDLADRIDRLGIVSMELPDLPIGGGWSTADNSVGVLLGVPSPDIGQHIETGSGTARLVPVTLLRPVELSHVVAGGRTGRGRRAALHDRPSPPLRPVPTVRRLTRRAGAASWCTTPLGRCRQLLCPLSSRAMLRRWPRR